MLRNVTNRHPVTRRQLHRCDNPDVTDFTPVQSRTITDDQLPCTAGSATLDLLRLLTVHEVTLRHRLTDF